MNYRKALKLANALIVLLSMGFASLSFAEQSLLTETHIEIKSSDRLSKDEQSNASAKSLSEHIGKPFVVYIWDKSCYFCIQALQTMNQLNRQKKIEGVSLLLEGSTEISPLTQDILDIPNTLKEMTHLYNPYLTGKNINATHLPEVRVFNRFGAVAARYPNFTNEWQEIYALVEQLNTEGFSQYQMTDPTEHPSGLTTRADGNLFNMKSLKYSSQANENTLKPYTSAAQFGAQIRTNKTPDHNLALSAPMASTEMTLNSGLEVGPDWQGLSANIVQKLNLDQRILVSADWWTASDAGEQLMALESAAPQEQSLMIGYESYWGNIQFGASLFHRSLSYRDDTGMHFDASHLLWNDRIQVLLGTSIYNSSHESSTTVNEANNDENRLHQLTLSHILDHQNRIAFSWYHDALQGIIDNPDELVQFENGGTTGRQYALYPTTRTQNNYIIQWINLEKSYGYSFYEDTWGIEQHQIFTTVLSQYKSWQLESRAAVTHQVNAKFFSDIYPAQDAQSLLTRNPSQAGYDSLKLSIQGEKELAIQLWNKSTFFTFKGSMEYLDFEELSQVNDSERNPATSLVLSTSIGLKLTL